jgi:protein-tyrosine phosphatase
VTLRVLFVCTGNVCRSPSAELLFLALAEPSADVAAYSAGTHALVGAPVDGPTAAALARVGLDAGGHRAVQFTPPMARGADLVLTATREHRDHVITAVPSVHRRTFTMKEFARLVHAIPTGMAAVDVVATANARRPVVGAVAAAEDDIPDPFRQDGEVAWRTVDQIGTALATALRAFTLIRQHTPSGSNA